MPTNPTLAAEANARNTLETQSAPRPETAPKPASREHAMPPLWRRLANLPLPLTREVRRKLPLYFLVRGPTRIAPAPIGAPLSETMRRRFEGAAIALWWPIGRALTLFWLWRDPPDRSTVVRWWREIEAAERSRESVPAATSFVGPSSTPSPEPAVGPSTQSEPTGAI